MIIREIEIEEVQNEEWIKLDYTSKIEDHYKNEKTGELCYFWKEAPVGFVVDEL